MVSENVTGTTFAPVHAHVEPTRLKFFLDSIGEHNPVYRDRASAEEAGFAGIAIPPTYLFCLEMLDADDPVEFLTRLGIDIGRVLHGEQCFFYRAPVTAGDKLVFESSVTGVTDKKGGAMTILEITTRVVNQDGKHVADVIRRIVVRNEGKRHD